LGWCLGRLLRLRQRRILEHLRLAHPEASAAQIAGLARGVYRHLGLLFFELLRLPTLRAAGLMESCTVRGRENFEAAAVKGRGVIVLTAHVGNWELGLARAAMLGYPCHVLTRSIRGQLGQAAADRLRESQRNVIPLPKRGSIQQILRVLRDGGALGVVLDQNRTEAEGVFVDFFGHPACTSPVVAVLAERLRCAVVPMRFHRCPDEIHHVVEFLPEIPWESPSESRDENIRHNTQRYTAAIEGAIREHPEQWIWMHRRWRTQPAPTVTVPPLCVD
jgi:KDO2-lipid IV(A) lauroyltransferase